MLPAGQQQAEQQTYHQNVVSLSPRAISGGHRGVTSLEDDVRGGGEGRVRKHVIVDHHVVAGLSGLNFSEASGSWNLSCAGCVCGDQQAAVVDAHSDGERALQRSESCKTSAQVSLAIPVSTGLSWDRPRRYKPEATHLWG